VVNAGLGKPREGGVEHRLDELAGPAIAHPDPDVPIQRTIVGDRAHDLIAIGDEQWADQPGR
jgi:hypothetical protein